MKVKFVLFLSLALLLACQNKAPKSVKKEVISTGNSIELTDAQLNNADIKLGKIECTTIPTRIKVNGKIEVPPQNMISISVPLGGYLKNTKLLPGMQIHKGEILAVMEDQQYIQLQEDFLIAKAQLSTIEEEYKRQKDLNQNKAASDKVFQNAQSSYLSQKIIIRSLSEKLKMIGINPNRLNENTLSSTIKIVSPINGFVSQVKVNIGKYVAPSDVMFELIDPTDIHLSLTLFEKDLKNISIGQKLYAYNNFDLEKKYLCQILVIGNDVTPERTIQIQCHFNSYEKNLIPGMYMNADIEVGYKNAYAIPTDAIVLYEGGYYVFTQIHKHLFEMNKITVQNTQNDLTQITFVDHQDLKNKTFVTQNAYTLLMKMKNKE
jgi:cobalt-zinc-cadmium efflux system membrane fusion protein